MSQDAIIILKQIRDVIDTFLSRVDAAGEPTPIVIQSSQPVYTRLSELSPDVQQDYAKADKQLKKVIEKKFNLKPSD